MENLKNRLNAFINIDVDQFWIDIIESNEEYILNLNRYDQLFNEGINSDGVNLDNIGGAYTEGYAAYKRSLGLPDDRNTLFINGYFYSQFELVVNNEGFKITASKAIELVRKVLDRFGEKTLGLTQESENKLSLHLSDLIREKQLKTLTI
jgi:hypothetical protein